MSVAAEALAARAGARLAWLPAVIPAAARRFRAGDPELRALISAAGGTLVADTPDVELTCSAERSDAPTCVVAVDEGPASGTPFALRAARRLAGTARLRYRLLGAGRRLRRLGYEHVSVLLWELDQPLRVAGGSNGSGTLVRRFPLGGVAVGTRRHAPTVLEEALREAGAGPKPESVLMREGGVVAVAESVVVRVTIGPGAATLRHVEATLASLRDARPPATVAERVAWVVSAGQTGIGEWTAEQRVPGQPAPLEPDGALLEDCLEFLLALFPLGQAEGRPLGEAAERLAALCPAQDGGRLVELAGSADDRLAGVPRGFAHGDFSTSNLLVSGNRLTGVIDWERAGPGRLPLVDLLKLRLEPALVARRHFDRALVGYLLPWAKAGGDEASSRLLQACGLDADPSLLVALAVGYWIERVDYEVRTYPALAARPGWTERHLLSVLRGLPRRLSSAGSSA